MGIRIVLILILVLEIVVVLILSLVEVLHVRVQGGAALLAR
jgi:hypothetical protein